MYFISIITSNYCNSNCYYCDFKKNFFNSVEVDTHYLKYIIDLFDAPLYLELSGGEPGLISNFEEVIKVTSDSKNVNFFQIMSNGTVRSKGYTDIFWKDKKFKLYNEHLFQDISSTRFIYHPIKFELELIKNEQKYKNIIVLTYKTLKSLLEHKELIDYFKPFSVFKMYLNVVDEVVDINKYRQFYKLLNDDYSKYMIKNLEDFERRNMSLLRTMCSKYPHMPSINLEEKKIYQCSIFFKKSFKADITKDNVDKLIRGTLFDYNKDFCDNCYFYDIADKRLERVLDARRGISFQNRDFGWYW